MLIVILLLAAASESAGERVPRELIVKMKLPPRQVALDEVSVAGVPRIDSLLDAGEVQASLPFSAFRQRIATLDHYLLLRFSEDIEFATEIERLERDPAVEWVSGNHLFQTDFVPNDSGFPART